MSSYDLFAVKIFFRTNANVFSSNHALYNSQDQDLHPSREVHSMHLCIVRMNYVGAWKSNYINLLILVN